MRNLIILCISLISLHSQASDRHVFINEAIVETLDAQTQQAIQLLRDPFTKPEQITQVFRSAGSLLHDVRDGRGLFLEVYATSSESVDEYMTKGKFKHPYWVKQLLISFGNIYREIILGELVGDLTHVPKAWREVFKAVKDKSPRLSSELMAAMQAHISRDMVFALLEVKTNFKSQTVKADYLKIAEALKNETPDIWKEIKSYGEMRQLLPVKWEEEILVAWTINLRKRAWMRAKKIAACKTPAEAQKMRDEVETNAENRIEEIKILGKLIK
jgi:Family of unknown function (DUF5995)